MIRVIMFLILSIATIVYADKCQASKMIYAVVDVCTLKVDGYSDTECIDRASYVLREYMDSFSKISPDLADAFYIVWKTQRLEEVCIKMCYGVATKQVTRDEVLSKVKNNMVNKYCGQ